MIIPIIILMISPAFTHVPQHPHLKQSKFYMRVCPSSTILYAAFHFSFCPEHMKCAKSEIKIVAFALIIWTNVWMRREPVPHGYFNALYTLRVIFSRDFFILHLNIHKRCTHTIWQHCNGIFYSGFLNRKPGMWVLTKMSSAWLVVLKQQLWQSKEERQRICMNDIWRI